MLRAVRRRSAARLAAPLLALALAALPPAGAAAQSAPITDPAALVLRPGDAVKLSVWKVPELDGEFPVLPNGTIAHPFLRDVVVAGLPLDRVRATLDSMARRENANAQVVMQPLLQVTVGGEVSAPNMYRHPAGTTIAQAMVLAGGITEQGNVRKVRLVRGGQVTQLDLTDPAGPATRLLVASGDQLIVDRRRGSFRESMLPFVSVLGTAASIATLIIRSRD